MKSWNDVELGEESGTGQTIKGFLQPGNRISILDDDVIKFSVVHTHLNTSPKFADKDHWEAGEECTEAYESFLKILIQSLLEHFKFISGYKIQEAVLWFCLRYEIDDMILWSVWRQGVSLVVAEHIQKLMIGDW